MSLSNGIQGEPISKREVVPRIRGNSPSELHSVIFMHERPRPRHRCMIIGVNVALVNARGYELSEVRLSSRWQSKGIRKAQRDVRPYQEVGAASGLDGLLTIDRV